MTSSSILWRRFESPGHDACRLSPAGEGWQLEGRAAFVHAGEPAQLTYRVSCDAAWHASEGRAHGFVGERAVDIVIARTRDGWTLNGAPAPGVEGCADLDFGFTPATNLIQLRRLALGIGQAGPAPAAWLDLDSLALQRLDQTYERRGVSEYFYEAPRFDYRELLVVDESGFVRRYPGLWEAE